MHSKQKGDRAEAAVLLSLIKKGKIVLTPFGENQRYDLVIEDDGFKRIQCKSGRLVRNGDVVVFNSCSSRSHNGGGKKDYRGQAEFFGVYCSENDKSYLVPVNEVGVNIGTLRLVPPKNNQVGKIRMAKDYEI